MSKYIKSFNSAAELISYFQTAEGKKYYTLMNTAGEEGIGTSITSGKKIISAYKSKYDYLTFTAVEAGATVKYNNLANTTAEYSTDGGITWNNGVEVTVTLTNIGDSVKYRGVISADLSTYSARFTFNSKKISASGSIMSMYNNNPDDTEIAYNYVFTYMFNNCSSLTTAPELPATTLAKYCYYCMFNRCSSLTTAPELPATTLAKYCYYCMFNRCSSLTTAPELPATTLAERCYSDMFGSCSSLTTAPELPATTLAEGCYSNMFYNCSSLTTAPELPATILKDQCYLFMFNGCSSLTTAPELPATNLIRECYRSLFAGCSSLTSVTHHITSWNTTNTSNWLENVAASGTVRCPSDSTIPSDNISGIPSGWTRENL